MFISFASAWYWFVIGAIVSYFIGCFNFAVLISRIKHKDIRQEGSGNPGTMNMSRTFGLKIGLINFFCDAFKGIIPVVCGYVIFKGMYFEGTDFAVSDFSRYLFGLFAVIGHIFPVTMKFKGGKGIATTLGVFTCGISCEVAWFIPIAIALLLGVVLYIYIFEWGSMASLIGVSSFTIWQGIIYFLRYEQELSSPWVIVAFMVLLAFNLLTWIAHRVNLYRLMGGEEHRTSIKKLAHKKRAKQ